MLFTTPPQTLLPMPLQAPHRPHFEQLERKFEYAHSWVILKPEVVRRSPTSMTRSESF